MKKYKVISPVLIIFYNRIDKTKNILENLLESNNDFSNLYFSVDGPKNYEDIDKIQEVIRLLKIYKKKLNNVEIIVNEKNLGLQQNIVKSIDYVLGINDTIIVLEDDHIVSPEFFHFCDHMLNKFRSNKKIFQISGSCYLPNKLKKDDIFFSKMPDCVGWATWKNSWQKLRRSFSLYDVYNEKKVQNYYNNFSKTHWFYEYLFREHYAPQKKGLWSTWWQLTIILEDGLIINPMKNLVIHDGLDNPSDAEHYYKGNEIKKKIRCENINLDKIKNFKVTYNKTLDNFNFKLIKKSDPVFKLKNRLIWFLRFYIRIYRLKNKFVNL